MDLQDFECGSMYFDDKMSNEVNHLIETAAVEYGTKKAETSLLRAYNLEPDNLAVLVALYRYYYYQHLYDKALDIADKAMDVSGRKLGMPKSWKDICEGYLGQAAMVSMGLLRFYLMALKGAAYLSLRLNKINDGLEILLKLAELDPHDRLHVKYLLEMVQEKSNVAGNENVFSIRGYS